MVRAKILPGPQLSANELFLPMCVVEPAVRMLAERITGGKEKHGLEEVPFDNLTQPGVTVIDGRILEIPLESRLIRTKLLPQVIFSRSSRSLHHSSRRYYRARTVHAGPYMVPLICIFPGPKELVREGYVAVTRSSLVSFYERCKESY